MGRKNIFSKIIFFRPGNNFLELFLGVILPILRSLVNSDKSQKMSKMSFFDFYHYLVLLSMHGRHVPPGRGVFPWEKEILPVEEVYCSGREILLVEEVYSLGRGYFSPPPPQPNGTSRGFGCRTSRVRIPLPRPPPPPGSIPSGVFCGWGRSF